MADKKITELQLRDNVSADVNFPSDDGIQSYRVTAAQVKDFVLAAGNVGTTQLAADSVTTPKIPDNAVTTPKINDGAITAAKLESSVAGAFIPTGSVIAFAAATAPNGYLLCDGSQVSRTTYAALFALLGVTHGSGNGTTTFHLPDYRGRFLRGVDGGAARDPDRAARTAMNTGGNTGDNVGSVQGHQFETHYHQITMWQDNGSGGSPFNPIHGAGASNNQNKNTGNPANGTHGSETRPVNAGVNFIIKT